MSVSNIVNKWCEDITGLECKKIRESDNPLEILVELLSEIVHLAHDIGAHIRLNEDTVKVSRIHIYNLIDKDKSRNDIIYILSDSLYDDMRCIVHGSEDEYEDILSEIYTLIAVIMFEVYC